MKFQLISTQTDSQSAPLEVHLCALHAEPEAAEASSGVTVPGVTLVAQSIGPSALTLDAVKQRSKGVGDGYALIFSKNHCSYSMLTSLASVVQGAGWRP